MTDAYKIAFVLVVFAGTAAMIVPPSADLEGIPNWSAPAHRSGAIYCNDEVGDGRRLNSALAVSSRVLVIGTCRIAANETITIPNQGSIALEGIRE